MCDVFEMLPTRPELSDIDRVCFHLLLEIIYIYKFIIHFRSTGLFLVGSW